MTKILVTGGAGNIASALIAKLATHPENRIVMIVLGLGQREPDIAHVALPELRIAAQTAADQPSN